MGMAERIKERRLAMNYTQEELAIKLGLQKSAVAKYENGRVENIKRSTIALMANILECSPAYLMGWVDSISQDKAVTINVLGCVAAGIPIDAITDIIDTEEISDELAKTGEFFGLKIKGNSMEPRIVDGDIVIVKQQNDAETGDIVIVTVNGDEATCKRLRKYKEGIELIPINPSYEPIYFNNDEISNKPVKIIGKVIELRAKF